VRGSGRRVSVDKIKQILVQHGRLSSDISTLENSSDLYNAGLTSLATVGLMLALEDEFDIEFPDSMLSRKTFSSIESIHDAIEELQQ